MRGSYSFRENSGKLSGARLAQQTLSDSAGEYMSLSEIQPALLDCPNPGWRLASLPMHKSKLMTEMVEVNDYPSVLIVDDQCFNIMAIRAQVESFGLKADTAVSGKMAISLVRTRLREMRKSPIRMYDLILLDYAMPEMDGLETCQGIR